MTRRTAPPAAVAGAPAVAVLAAAALLSGCASLVPPPQEGPDRATAVAIDEALLHTVARQAAALPEVTCVDVTLVQAGLPYTVPGDPFVVVRATTRGPAAREALARDLGERFWRAGLTSVLSLRLELTGTDGLTDLGQLLTGSPGSVSRTELEAAYGPRPTPTLQTPPPDPGEPGCPS